MYTIGEVSQMFNLPISTLRYYDKEGLFPDLERASGIRKFNDKTIEAIHVIECLKNPDWKLRTLGNL
jgi:DNA-binding transcriptional MerR regulator